MKISKITKILPIALAFTVCGAFADGADESTTATVNYSLTLNDYIKITTSTENVSSETTFDQDYGGINITTPLVGKFNVISNAENRTLKLTGTCPNTGDSSPIYAYDASAKTFKLVFTNNTHKPDSSSVDNIKGNAPEVDSNPNAIAFAVTVTETREHGTEGNPTTSLWEEANNAIAYTMPNGVLDLTYTVATTAEANTFNTQDMSGTYQATLTLTDHGAL